MTYRYTINDADVNALGDWEIGYERNAGQIFFRRILTGDLTFRGDDYQTIMAMSDCDVLEFKIYCGASEHWEGQFKFPYDFDIDEDSCAMVGTPEVVDEYNCILANHETEYDVGVPSGSISVDTEICAGGGSTVTMGACYPLFEYFDEIINDADKMNCSLTISSSFMLRDAFPNGTPYAGAYGTDNYITAATNRLEFIHLTKNLSLRTTSCGIGNSAIATFKQFEELLRNRFNAYWFIDENGHFRIEHIHFFDADFPESDYEVGTDLTTLVSSNGKVFAYRRNKYTYETGDLYDQEFFSWQYYTGTEFTQVHGADFQGEPIFYGDAVGEKSDCVPGVFKDKDIATPKFWSDVEWYILLIAAGTEDELACDGFLILDVDLGGTNVVNCEASILGAGNIRNMHLSTAGLQDHYFQYDRIFLDGDMNDGDVTTFTTAQRLKLQEPIEYEWCCDDGFDPLEFIRTELGDGAVKAATQKKRSIEVELLY